MADVRDQEDRVEDHEDAAHDEGALDDTEDAAEDLVHERVLLEQRLAMVEGLDEQRERDVRGHEHDEEPEHDRVLVRHLVPVRGEERADDVAQVGREQEREEHRPEAEQPADRPLHEPQHEHAEEEQQEEQVEPVEVDNDIPDVHAVSSGVTEAAGSSGRRATG